MAPPTRTSLPTTTSSSRWYLFQRLLLVLLLVVPLATTCCFLSPPISSSMRLRHLMIIAAQHQTGDCRRGGCSRGQRPLYYQAPSPNPNSSGNREEEEDNTDDHDDGNNTDDHDDDDTAATTATSSSSSTLLSSSSSHIQIYESDFPGAGIPRPDLDPSEIPILLMMALSNNDFPTVDDGLKSMWEFSNDQTKFVFHNNRTDFITTAHETAKEFPTSFYGVAMNGKSWTMETELNRVGGESGCWIATQVMKTICSDGRIRRWQWELRKNRRPPNRNCWYVESIGSSNRKGQFEPE